MPEIFRIGISGSVKIGIVFQRSSRTYIELRAGTGTGKIFGNDRFCCAGTKLSMCIIVQERRSISIMVSAASGIHHHGGDIVIAGISGISRHCDSDLF